MAAQLQRPQHQPTFSFPSSSTATTRGATDTRNTSTRLPSDPTLASGAVHLPTNSISSQITNPFRTPKHTPHTSASSNALSFSPVSPIQEYQGSTSSQATPRPLTAPQSRKMSQEPPRKSFDLRTIDGKPYPGREAEAEKPRKVKVAQDMYAGDLPPGYERQDYKGPVADEKGHKHTGSCHKCGGNKRPATAAPVSSDKVAPLPPSHPQNIDCNKCGGKRSTPPSSFPGAASGNPRSLPPIQSSEAGPSNAPHGHRHKCTKCGRRKRPESMSTSGSSSQSHSPQQTSFHRTVPSIQTNGVPVDINIEPPTAITERAPTLPFSPSSTTGTTPLMKTEARIQAKEQNTHKKSPSRSGSISTLFRSLSRRKKSLDQSSPNQPMPNESQQSSGRNSANYSRLRPDDYIERPGSPFSFVDKPKEEQAFEMNDMRQSKQPARRDSWDKADESAAFLGSPSRPKLGRSQSTTAAKYPSGSAQPVDDVYLSLPPDQRPGITRFKSLRSGVNKAASGLSRSASQISRNTSLRRLESVKKVPQLWYRDDMAIEGASSEYNNYGY